MYKNLVPLDPTVHGKHKIGVLSEFSVAAGLHSVFCTATEFVHAGLEFPIVFIPADGDPAANGAKVFAPVALLGVEADENLVLDGERWDARYVPAFIRRYPFITVGQPNSERAEVLIDAGWSGFSTEEGEPLFEADKKPAPALQRALDFLERFDVESQRTRAVCDELVRLDLLRPMKANVQLPDGTSRTVDGFFTVDEDKLRDLPESEVVSLHRQGLLMLINLHIVSLGNLQHLVARKAARMTAAGAATLQ